MGANSLETIITHLVGSESETLRCAADLPSERDRESEFEGKKITKAEVLALHDGADAVIQDGAAHRRNPAPVFRPSYAARRASAVGTYMVSRKLRRRM